ncbi:hypothetical protein TSOC_014490, partial [Tetrabaena socialis]
MAAAAGSSLEEGLGRFRELIDAATRNDPRSDEPVNRRARGAGRLLRVALIGRLLPLGGFAAQPALVGAALVNCLGCFSTIRRQHPPSADWAKPLLQHGIVPAAAGLLKHVLRAHRQSPGDFGIIAGMLAVVCGAPSALVEGSTADQLYAALTAVQELTATFDAAATAFAAGITIAGGASAVATFRAAACGLWGQLAAPATLQALADAVRWVEAEAWPAEHAMAAAMAGAGGPAQQAPAVGQGPAETSQDVQRQGRALGVLASAACVVRGMVSRSDSLLLPAEGAGAASAGSVPAAAAARQRSLLVALRDSGVLSALSAAVLSAPPCPNVAAGAKALEEATAAMTIAQYDVFSTLWSLSRIIAPGLGLSTATELLAAPDVQPLCWAALEQLAAAAPAAAAGSSSSSRTGAPGGGCGARGAGGEAGSRWLLLLQPHVIQPHSDLGGQLVFGYASMMGAALDAPAKWLRGSQQPPGGTRCADTAASLAAAKRLLPPPRRLAVLAASCARTVCAEVEAELRALSAGAAASTGAGGGSTRVRHACSSVVEQLVNLALILDTVAADESLPDLLETCGWALRAQVAAMAEGGSGAAFREGEEGHMSPAARAAQVVTALAFKLQ